MVFPRQHQMGYMSLKRDYQARRYPPLGLMYISSALKEIGLQTDLVDATAADVGPEDILRLVGQNNYLFAGFYADTTTKHSVRDYCRTIRRNFNTAILIGGPATFIPDFFLEDENTIVVRGEGEQTVKKVSRALLEKQDFSGLPGISYLKNGSVFHNPPALLVENLDSLAFPDRAAIKMKNYHDYYNLNCRSPFATIITSRGCPTNCAYCTSSNFWGRKVRFRSVANVIEEIKYVISRHRVRYIDFVDDMFNLNRKWLNDFCDAVIREKLAFRWSCSMYPLDTPRGLLKKVKQAGGNTIRLGLQSADPDVLVNVHRRPESVKHARGLIENARKLGFIIFLDFIFGLPGENRESVEKSITFAVRTNPQITKFYKLDILEGSEIYYQTLKSPLVTSLSDREIDEYCAAGWKKFYFRPVKVLDFLALYLKNPVMIRRAFRHLNVFRSFLKWR